MSQATTPEIHRGLNPSLYSDCVIDPAEWDRLWPFTSHCNPAETAARAACTLVSPEMYISNFGGLGALFELMYEHRDLFAPAALAIVVRELSIRYGIYAREPAHQCEIAGMFRWLRQHAGNHLMTVDERQALRRLPAEITIYRGQLHMDDPHGAGITGMSWSLCRTVADYYSHHDDETPHGWLITATVQRQSILTLFRARGEHEVVVEAADIRIREVERGAADHFPQEWASDSFA